MVQERRTRRADGFNADAVLVHLGNFPAFKPGGPVTRA